MKYNVIALRRADADVRHGDLPCLLLRALSMILLLGHSNYLKRLCRRMARHPNKHIGEAIGYAQDQGWTFTKASGKAHIFGTLWCPQGDRDGCRFRVYSTPRVPEDHARRIRRAVDGCPH